jgi:hypothetical protein
MPSLAFLENRAQILALARTAKASSNRCSFFVGILDETVALAFDMECNAVLTEWEMETETRRIESVVAEVVTAPSKPAPTRTRPIPLNAQVHP